MGEREFVQAVQGGDAAAALAMLDGDPSLANAMEEGVPITMRAVYFGHADLAAKIAARKERLDIFEAAVLGDRVTVDQRHREHASDIGKHSGDGFTALGFAAFFGHRELVKDLLGFGADPNLASTNGLRVIPLHSALSNGHKAIARELIEAGSDVNLAAGDGWTPLHYTAHEGDEDTTRLLLERGARRDAVRDDGRTPAQVARDRGHEATATLLEDSH